MVSLRTHTRTRGSKRRNFKLKIRSLPFFGCMILHVERERERGEKIMKRLLLFIEQPSIAYSCTIFTFLSRPVKWKPSRRVHQPSHILPKKNERREFIIQLNSLIYLLYTLVVILCKNCTRKGVGRLLFIILFPHLCSYFACSIIWCRCHARSFLWLCIHIKFVFQQQQQPRRRRQQQQQHLALHYTP